MKKISVFLIQMLLLTSFCFGCNKKITPTFSPISTIAQTKTPTITKDLTPIPTLTPVQSGNIKIIDDSAIIYSEKSSDSSYLDRCKIGDVFCIIKTVTDNKGTTWYQVQKYANDIGWIDSKYCEATTKLVNTEWQTTGKLLDPKIDKDILLKLLEIDYSSIDGFIKIFGKDYKKIVDDFYPYQIEYKYPNGFSFYCDEDGYIYNVSYNNINYLNSDFKKIISNVSNNPGNEILYFYNSSELLILQEGTNNIIGNYKFNYDSLGDAMVIDFLNEGCNQIFINEQKHNIDDSKLRFFAGHSPLLTKQGSTKNGLYKLDADNRLVKVINSSDFFQYANEIESSIINKIFVLDIKIESYKFKQSTALPEKIFYNRKNFPDHNAALSTVIDWKIELIDKKYYAIVDIYVVFDMLNAFWGLPEPNGDDFGFLPNDLSRTRIVIDYNSKIQKIIKVDTLVKYNNLSFMQNKELEDNELNIRNGPDIGQDFVEACNMLTNKSGIFKNRATVFFNGVKLSRDWNDQKTVDEIYVRSPEYLTSRGIKVGDSENKVLETYGIADQGLPGDEFADYFVTYDFKGHLGFAGIFGMTFRYKDKKVVSYQTYSYIID